MKSSSRLWLKFLIPIAIFLPHSSPAQSLQCAQVFEHKSAAAQHLRILHFDARSAQSVIEAIASLSYEELRSPVSQVLRPAEAALRRQSPAKQLIVDHLAKMHDDPDYRYTAEHSWSVAVTSVKIGRSIGMTTDELVALFYAALAHDLGKVTVPVEVLNKPGRLDDDELKIMRSHVEVIFQIFAEEIKSDPEFAAYIAVGSLHHERWDGTGYPFGKKGPELPLASRVMGIADAFHAMTSNRPYREKMPFQKVLSILARERNTGQFDPELIDLVLPPLANELGESLPH